MASNLTLLRRGLRDFGLDPIEWCLDVQSVLGSIERVEICSLADGNVHFEGWARRGHWLEISYYAPTVTALWAATESYG